jgi:hypothetical protein
VLTFDRGKNGAFGEPYQQVEGEKTVTKSPDKLVEYGEKTWEVSDVVTAAR